MVFLGTSATQFRKFTVIQRQLCLRRIFIRLFMGGKHSETVCQKWVLAMQVCVQFPVAVLQMNLFQFPFGFGSGTFLICTLFTTFSFLTLSDLFKAMKMLSVNANPRTVWLLMHIVFILYFPNTYTCNIFVHILYMCLQKKKKKHMQYIYYVVGNKTNYLIYQEKKSNYLANSHPCSQAYI